MKPSRKPSAPSVPSVPSGPRPFRPGDEIRHRNGAVFIIRHITPEGIALHGTATLVQPHEIEHANP
jgi:hypothetical protein